MANSNTILGFLCLFFASSIVRGQSIECDSGWHPGESLPGVDGYVHALMEWDPDGNGSEPPLLVIGGSFQVAGSQLTRGIAGFDGVSWTNFDGGLFPTTVYALTEFQGDLIAAGAFNSGSGTPAKDIARWDGEQWHALGMGLNGIVYTLTEYDGQLIAGGMFTASGALELNRIAAWDGNEWHAMGAGFDNRVNAITEFQGTLVAGGLFKHSGDLELSNIAGWDGDEWQPIGDGIQPQEFGPGLVSLVSYQGRLIASGGFGVIGAPPPWIYQWDGSSWETVPGTETMSPWIARAFFEHDGLLYAGRNHDSNAILWWDGLNWGSLNNPIEGYVRALAAFNGNLVVGGEISSLDTPLSSVAIQSGDQWVPPGTGFLGSVGAIGQFRGQPVIVGDFVLVGESIIEDIAIWNEDSWNPLGNGINAIPEDVIEWEDTLLVSVRYYSTFESAVLRWDGKGWDEFESPGGDPLREFLIFQGNLFAVTSYGVVRWNGSNWESIGDISGVEQLAIFDGDLIAAGNLYSRGSVEEFGLARWDGTAWHPIPYDANPIFADVVEYQGKLIVTNGNTISAWDGSSWSELDDLDQIVWELAIYNGELFAGGLLSTFDGPGVAKWNGAEFEPFDGGLFWGEVTSLMHVGRHLFAGGYVLGSPNYVSRGVISWGPFGKLSDADSDTLVTTADLPGLLNCFTGATRDDAGAAASPECLCVFNANGDADVDLADFAAFQVAFGS